MRKDAYYFPHDSNARNDPKIIKLLKEHGWAGYGLYWAIVEMLREDPCHELTLDYDIYSYALRTDGNKLKSIITEYKLFKIEGNKFYSESLKNRMHEFEKRKLQARKAANIRWGNESK